MGKIIPTKQKKECLPFIKSNLGKISQREIARKLKIGKTTINKWAEELGFKHQKHTVNEHFFDKLTEESAYLLEYIYADGNVAWNPKKGYQALTITASAKDKEHLEKLRKILSSSKPLLFSLKTNSYRLIANNKNLCKRLIMLGVFPNKSLIVQFPDFLPENYLPHFIRGVIDGDGTVYFCKRQRSPYFSIKIASGSREFCEGLVKAVYKSLKIKANIRKVGKNTYIAEYTCLRAKKLAHYLYTNANIFMERKFLQYKNNILEEKR